MEKIQTPFRKMTFPKKLEHIWEYYRAVVYGVIIGIALLAYFIYKIVTPQPEAILNVTLVNGNSYDAPEENVFLRYLKEQGYDLSEYTAYVDAHLQISGEDQSQKSATSLQLLSAMTMVGEIDLLAGDELVFGMMGGSDGLLPLDQALSQELLEKYKDSLFFLPDAETGEENAVGIWLREDSGLVADGYYQGKALMGIPYTAKHPEMAAEALRYLLEE